MAKPKSTSPRPSTSRFLRNLPAISSPPSPSSALLAILAGLVGVVNPFPIACHEFDGPLPTFLCPSLQPRAELPIRGSPTPPRTTPPVTSVPGSSRATLTTPPTATGSSHYPRALAPGYTLGSDGRWRKLSTWSLYGSTICVVRGTALHLHFRAQLFFPNQCHDASSTAGTLPMDDLASTPATSQPNETELLPPGWSRTYEESAARTILILSLSLLLAALIAAFIFFLLWRRRRKHELQKDLEKKLMKKKGPQQSIDSEKEHRAKSKLWARATSRWKESIRQSARRRRNARLSSTSLHASNNSVTSLHNTTPSTNSSPQQGPVSLPPSRPPSPTPSTHSIHSSPRTDHEPRNNLIDPPPPPPPSSPPLPPAYQGRSHLSADVPPVKDLAQLSSGSSLCGSRLSQVDSHPSDSRPPSPLEGGTTPSNHHVAHVATDDKAVLQQMMVMGSQPPTEPESSDVCGSAPVLYEDDTQSLEYEDTPEPALPSIGFPSPPTILSSSKGKAAALEYYDYDDLDVEPDPQPSAPPFEAENPTLPSAPLEGEAQPVDHDDDPTASADADLPQLDGHPVDASRTGPSRPEPLPRYRP